MGIWDTRTKALAALSGKFKREGEILEDMFTMISKVADQLAKEATEFSFVCSVSLLKGKNLALGILDMNLNGLGQEAGALLRPFVEVVDLLTYFEQDHSRIYEALGNRLPSAGQIAQRISSPAPHSLRKYLNSSASHFGFDMRAVRHLFRVKDMSVVIDQPHIDEVFQQNLSMLFLFLSALLGIGAACLEEVGDQLSTSIAFFQIHGHQVFFPEDDIHQIFSTPESESS